MHRTAHLLTLASFRTWGVCKVPVVHSRILNVSNFLHFLIDIIIETKFWFNFCIGSLGGKFKYKIMLNSYHKVSSILFDEYNKVKAEDFLQSDPIGIVHLLSSQQDIEVGGLLIASISWGRKEIIISKAHKILHLMDFSPFKFISNYSLSKNGIFKNFKHRTFTDRDLADFCIAMKKFLSKWGKISNLIYNYWMKHQSFMHLASAFVNEMKLYGYTYGLGDPIKGSAAKRLFMYFRWMVRKDPKGIDFGFWNFIPASELIIPCDIRTLKVAQFLGITKRRNADIKTAIEITNFLKQLEPADPLKFDIALQNLFPKIASKKSSNDISSFRI